MTDSPVHKNFDQLISENQHPLEVPSEPVTRKFRSQASAHTLLDEAGNYGLTEWLTTLAKSQYRQ